MCFLRHSLHPPVARTEAERLLLHEALSRRPHAGGAAGEGGDARRAAARAHALTSAPRATAEDDVAEIALTTVSLRRSFDAMITVGLKGADVDPKPLLVDSGNSMLVMPRWEDIAPLAARGDYEVLGQATEPWGCPANIVRGPVEIATAAGGVLEIPDCTFFACTDVAPDGRERTANFGVGCLSPRMAWTVLPRPGVELSLTSPLAGAPFRYAVFDYAAATDVLAVDTFAPKVDAGSRLVLQRAEPAGFQWFDLLPDLAWMSLRARSLAIADRPTAWPGDADAIAMIDTGGTCLYLSDPHDLVCEAAWPGPVANPEWTARSTACESTAAAVTVEIGDDRARYRYTVDPVSLPPSARGLTLVMCRENEYMRGQHGMNIGGLSALCNDIAIDYAGRRVGFRPK
jgi:hypothetical protein